MNNTSKSIALIGDSVLDDFYWLEDPTQDVKQQLSDLLPETKIHNFAVDESIVDDVLNGCYPPCKYVDAREEIFGGTYPYPTTNKGRVYPLKLLAKYQPEYVILSIGGNDGRIHLDNIIWSADALIKAIVNDGLEEKFNRVWLMVAEYNTVARNLYKQLGFTQEGVQRQALYKDGFSYDYIMMSILKGEYNEKYPSI